MGRSAAVADDHVIAMSGLCHRFSSFGLIGDGAHHHPLYATERGFNLAGLLPLTVSINHGRNRSILAFAAKLTSMCFM